MIADRWECEGAKHLYLIFDEKLEITVGHIGKNMILIIKGDED